MDTTITAQDFGKQLSSGAAKHIVDVRTEAEFVAVHVEGARLSPLDALEPARIGEALKAGRGEMIYLLCKGGTRAGRAAEQFRAAGMNNVCVVEGGTEACIAAGVPVVRGAKAGIPLDGQVRIAIGAILLVGYFGAHVIPVLRFIIPIMGAGLVFSGVTGFCGLALIIAKAPWNKAEVPACCRV